jgi:hypothetical protein
LFFYKKNLIKKPIQKKNQKKKKKKKKKPFQIHFKLLLVVLLNTAHLMRLRSPILSA